MNKRVFESFHSQMGLQFKNRIVMAPMTNCQSHEDGTLGDDEYQWLKRRAEGGFSAAVTACSHVRADAKAYRGEIGCFDDKHIPGLSQVAALWNEHQAFSFLQLFHGGYRSPRSLTGVQPVSASAVQLDFPGFEIPRALTGEEIEQLVIDFKNAAIRAQKAGFPGIEIHGANGYLFTQFLNAKNNSRTDEYGGSLENRARFLLRVTEEIRKTLPRPFVLGVRLLGEDSAHQRGFDIDDTCAVVGWLKNAGVDYIHLSLSNAMGKAWKYADGAETIVARIRKAIGEGITLIACGGIDSVEKAQTVLDEGADLIAMAKTAIAAPDWPKLAREPGYKFEPLPLTEEQLRARSVQQPLIDYLRSMKGLVKS